MHQLTSFLLAWLSLAFTLPDNVSCSDDGSSEYYGAEFIAQTPLSTTPGGFDYEKPWGLVTYGNVPHVPCMSKERKGIAYDIAVLGAPFDTATTGRPGARFGPQAIRSGSTRINADAWSVYTGENVLRSNAIIVDCGNAPMTRLDNRVALKQLETAHEIITARPPASEKLSPVPRVVVLGGDHTTTLSALRTAYKKWGKLSVIHFDAHIDTWDPKVIGGGISDYAAVNHGTFLHIAHEEGLLTNTSVHAGIRAPLARPTADIDNDRRCGFEFITARDLDRLGTGGVIERLKARVGTDANVYLSVDIDVLDPAYAPATGTAETGGWTTRELLTILDGLVGLKIVGADVVEVAPAYDNAGEITGLAAAQIAQSLLYLMVKTPMR